MPHPYLQALERAVLTFWVGGLWTAGFVVAPILFAELSDRALAGTLAGAVFGVMGYVGLACGAALLMLDWRLHARRRFIAWRNLVLVAMLALTALGEFVLAPWIAQLRAVGLVESARFAQAHGLASGVYVLNCMLGLALVITTRQDGGTRRAP